MRVIHVAADADGDGDGDADTSLYTRALLRFGSFSAACSHRSIESAAELARARRHAAVWRAVAPPYRVTERRGPTAAAAVRRAAADADIVLFGPRACPPSAVERVAPAGHLDYAVVTARGAAALTAAAAHPLHMPVDMLIAALGDLGAARVRCAARPAGPRRAWAAGDNVKRVLPDASVQRVVALCVALFAVVGGAVAASALGPRCGRGRG